MHRIAPPGSRPLRARFRGRSLAGLALLLLILPAGASAQTAPREGIEERPLGVHAIVGATLHLSPTEVIEGGTIIIRDGRISDVGPGIAIPAEARVHDATGQTITAGWIDLDHRISPRRPGEDESRAGRAWNERIHPEIDLASGLVLPDDTAEAHRHAGFTHAVVHSDHGILGGRSAIVRLSPAGDETTAQRQTVVLSDIGQSAALEHGGWGSGGYPGSRMGAVALLRQTLLDARWYHESWRFHDEDPTAHPRPEVNEALAALGPLLEGKQRLFLRSRDELDLLGLGEISNEFGLTERVILGCGTEQLWLDEIAALGAPIVLPLDFPDAPTVDGPGGDSGLPLRTLELWARAPENPIRVDRAGIPFAFTPRGLGSPGDFSGKVRASIERGLSPERALAAVTTTPASILGVSDRAGAIFAGAGANLTVLDGAPFAEDTEVVGVWIHGVHHPTSMAMEKDLRGTWELTLVDGDALTVLTMEVTGTEGRPSLKVLADGNEVRPAELHRKGNEVGLTLGATAIGAEGFIRLGGAYSGGEVFEGIARTPAGKDLRAIARRTAPFDETAAATEEAEPSEEEAGEVAEGEGRRGRGGRGAGRGARGGGRGFGARPGGGRSGGKSDPAVWAGSADEPLPTPLGARGRTEAPVGGGTVLFRDATVWTSGPEGILANTSILVKDGKIARIGGDIPVPGDALVVDCEGRHITPGIIDPHSHTAIRGGVNEGTQAVTAEVRIGDVVEADDINIYRQLAGGVTTAHLMHGSANPIGGQGQVIKLKWGAGPRALQVPGPKLIKCALGENVKQSNWDAPTGRYPQTRMGVEQIFRDAFWAARAYMAEWSEWRAAPKGSRAAPRVDLELEALAEILRGERLIHCHSYRQDEILMLMRVAEDFGFRIGTFQHVLEGYKIAEEIARHGAAASSFSDWWAYKFEVYDAIPYNGAILQRAGVLTSYNSDSDELARRLNVEAAKAVKYGGVPPAEALKFVTLNAAIQLAIGDRTGSIEVGKDADIAIWSGDPLSTYSRCTETWIDGFRYYSLAEEEAWAARDTARRELLVRRVLEEKHGAPSAAGDDAAPADPPLKGAGR